MGSWCTAGLVLLLATVSFSAALAPNNLHRHLDLTVPEDEEVEAPRRSIRAANPESFADYFRKLQLAQSELSKNASVGEAEIEKVFKSHGLEIGNETHDENGTTNSALSSSITTEQYETKGTSDTTEFPTTGTTEKLKKTPCHAASGTCVDIPGGTTTKPVKKNTTKPDKSELSTTVGQSTTLQTTTSSPDDLDNSTATTTEPDSTFSPSTTTAYSSGAWWGVSRKSKPKHLKSTIARQVVNKIKTSRRRSHFD